MRTMGGGPHTLTHIYTLLYWPGRAYILQHSLLCRYLTFAAFQGRRPSRERASIRFVFDPYCATHLLHVYLQYLSLYNSPTAGVDTSSVHAENERRSTTSKKTFQQACFPEREKISNDGLSVSHHQKNPHLHVLRECA
jgi:hypothetical protein